jgi:hypothetical protein
MKHVTWIDWIMAYTVQAALGREFRMGGGWNHVMWMGWIDWVMACTALAALGRDVVVVMS